MSHSPSRWAPGVHYSLPQALPSLLPLPLQWLLSSQCIELVGWIVSESHFWLFIQGQLTLNSWLQVSWSFGVGDLHVFLLWPPFFSNSNCPSAAFCLTLRFVDWKERERSKWSPSGVSAFLQWAQQCLQREARGRQWDSSLGPVLRRLQPREYQHLHEPALSVSVSFGGQGPL